MRTTTALLVSRTIQGVGDIADLIEEWEIPEARHRLTPIAEMTLDTRYKRRVLAKMDGGKDHVGNLAAACHHCNHHRGE
jgi:hypothetical protein